MRVAPIHRIVAADDNAFIRKRQRPIWRTVWLDMLETPLLHKIQTFLDAAMTVGLGARLAELAGDVQDSIDAFPNTRDRRYLLRLEMQRDRLANPDLRLVGAVLHQLCEGDPSLRAVLEPGLKPLLSQHHYLSVLLRQSGSQA